MRAEFVLKASVLLPLFFNLAATVDAQVNTWTNPASDHWEGPYWSLGVPPAVAQSVVITNDGWKAVAIFPSTPADYPGSMTVRDLTLSAIPGSLNILMLNYSGTEKPLEVLNSCNLGANGVILNLYSGLKVDGPVSMTGGQLNQEGGTLSMPGAITAAPGGMSLTNAQATLGTASFLGLPGGLTLSGGSTTCSNLTVGFDPYHIPVTAQLLNGNLDCGTLTVLGSFSFENSLPAAVFSQSGASAVCRVSGLVSNLSQISILGGRFSAGAIWQHGLLVLSNSVVPAGIPLDLGGKLLVENMSIDWGPMTLSANGILDFDSAPSMLRFPNLSAVSWINTAKLQISHWFGALSGGGGSGLFFGSDGGGLTLAQVQQLEFFRPVGLLAGAYKARILPTGEVVPTGRLSVYGWPQYEPVYHDYYRQYTFLTAPVGLTNVVGIAARRGRSTVLKADGTLLEWGEGYNGDPMPAGLSNVVAISGGDLWGMALRADGTAWSWGSYKPVQSHVVAICAGFGISAVRADGTLWAPFDPSSNGPSTWSNLVAVAAGEDYTGAHMLGLTAQGTVLAWGIYCSYGETNVPGGLSNVVAVAARGSQSLALRNDGTVVGWGKYQPPPLSNIVAIAAAPDYAMAVRNDGTVASWGNPPPDPGLSNVTMIAASTWHNLALLDPIPVRPPTLTAPRLLPSGAFEFRLRGELGKRYVVESSTNLADWDFFQNVPGRIGTPHLSDTRPPSGPPRFYRARWVR